MRRHPRREQASIHDIAGEDPVRKKIIECGTFSYWIPDRVGNDDRASYTDYYAGERHYSDP